MKDHCVLVVPLYGQTPTAAKRERGNLILCVDIPVQTKLFVSAYKQRKVCLSVKSKVLFLMKSSEGDQQKKKGCREKKTIFQSNKRFLCKELPGEMGLVRYRFNSTSQVTGLPDATPLAPRSPYLIAHTSTRTNTQAPNQCRQQELVKVKNRRKGKGGEEKVGR